MTMRVIAASLAIVAIAAAAAACGGDDAGGPDKYEGAGAAAAAAYFNQEKAGGILPGGDNLQDYGIKTNDVRVLDARGAKARFCMPYTFRESINAASQVRIYIVALNGREWSVQPQENVTSCEGVS